MITCPLCNKLVEVAENNSHVALRDDEPDDFRCPTRVELTDNISQSHYTRSAYPHEYPEYMVWAPPFQIIWFDGRLGRVRVILWSSEGFSEDEQVYVKEQVTHREFIETAKRFEKLKAFA